MPPIKSAEPGALARRHHDSQRLDTNRTLHRVEVAASLLSEALARLRDTSEMVRSTTGWGPYEAHSASGSLLKDADALVTLLEEVRREARKAHASCCLLSQTAVSIDWRLYDERMEQEQQQGRR